MSLIDLIVGKILMEVVFTICLELEDHNKEDFDKEEMILKKYKHK